VNLLGDQQWLIIALIFFGFLAYAALIRRKDERYIERRFGKDRPRAMSFGVNYFGRSSEPGGPLRSSGFLVLLPDRLFYRSRLTGLELEIPGDRIAGVGHDRRHKGADLHQSVMIIEFKNKNDEVDRAAFKVPYPPQWIRAIEATLLPGGSSRSDLAGKIHDT